MENKFSAKEKEILKFWQDNKIFEKSLKKPSPKGDYVFYDGPPFATGLPHYGHFPSSIMKDVVPRYWTMQGYRVERKWGWDCHGLPIENIVERELGFKSKKDIENFGIDKFNEACRSKVLEYASEWEKIIPRLGRWVDMKNAYKTMDLDYMESIWWVFKQLWDKGLIYSDYKSMHVCPRCETTLSQMEVSEGYKDIKDLSVTVKFELVDEPGTFLLVWTTTPWTLPGNVALALGPQIKYLKLRRFTGKWDKGGKAIYDNVIIAKDIYEKLEKDPGSLAAEPFHFLFAATPESGDYPESPKILEEFKAKDLGGKKYKPLFDDYKNSDIENKENFYTIVEEDFVNTEEGTGVVHIAPAFGEDDMQAGKKYKLPFIQHVNMDGTIKDEIKGLAGLNVKPIDDHQSTDIEIIKNLAGKGLLFGKEKYEHSYPHCWRCDTPLINYATSSWFVNVSKIHKDLLKEAKGINWSPAHLKEGRFGKWLEGARDWSISRQRFWASVMPIWKCESCEDTKVYGSVADLEKDSGKKITDLHKHIIDKVTVPCKKCGKTMKRVPDVLDTWFDSGSMPYAQAHYPFENKKEFEKNFPAEFIAEGVDQTRAWFYYLHVIGVALKKKPAYQNVMVNGIVLAEDGKKMSKKLKNYPDPNEVMDKYGADALRYYFLTSPVMEAENLNFSETAVKESLQKNVMLLSNILSFYQIYQKDNLKPTNLKPTNLLDRWILAKLNILNQTVTEKMEAYQIVKAARPITEFINELSTWYVRRSRERFRDGDEAGVQTLGFVLQEFSKIIAPFIPFIAEDIYRSLSDNKESVHLEDWPEVDKKLIDRKILDNMDVVQKIVELAHSLRHLSKIKVRQPLSELRYNVHVNRPELDTESHSIISDEVNVKNVVEDKSIKDENVPTTQVENEISITSGGISVILNTEITDDLAEQGEIRDLSRAGNKKRKEKGYYEDNKIIFSITGHDNLIKKYKEELLKQLGAGDIILKKDDSINDYVEYGLGKFGITVGTLTLANGRDNPDSATYSKGSKNVIVSSVKLTANSVEDVKIIRIIFTQNGTLDSKDLKNPKLHFNDDVYEPSLTVKNQLVFEFVNHPILVTKGKTIELSVSVDTGNIGKRTIRFDIERELDISSIGLLYNGTILVSSGTGAMQGTESFWSGPVLTINN